MQIVQLNKKRMPNVFLYRTFSVNHNLITNMKLSNDEYYDFAVLLQYISRVVLMHLFSISPIYSLISCWVNLLIGWRQGFEMNISWKYGEQMANTILCACNNFPSQANVTSTKSPRSNKFWKPDAIFSWKRYQSSFDFSVLIWKWDWNLSRRKGVIEKWITKNDMK